MLGLMLLRLHPDADLARAQQVETLAPMTVSASILPTQLTDAPGSVGTLSRDDLLNQRITRFSEILAQIPGVHVDEIGSRGGISSIYLRGGDPNFTAVMIDGIRINDSTNPRGGSVDMSLLTPDNVERIEFVKGPASALYGSDALAGVVNIITQPAEAPEQSLLRVEGGSFDHARSYVASRGHVSALHYAGSVAFVRNGEQVEQDRYQNISLSGDLNWKPSAAFTTRLSVHSIASDTRAFPEGSGGPRLSILRDTESRDTHLLAAGLDLSHTISDQWSQELAAQVSHQIQDVDSPGVKSTPAMFRIPPAKFTTRFTQWRGSWTQRFVLHSQLSLAGGFQVIQERGERSGLQRLTALGLSQDQPSDFVQTRTVPAAVAEASWTPRSWMRFVAGLRVDAPERFRARVTPRASVMLQLLASTQLRAQYGQGFKLPSFQSLADPFIGNPALRPETSQGWDAGIRQQLTQAAAVEIAYFHNRFSNLIDLDPALAAQGTFLLRNINSVITQGIETSIMLKPLSGWTVNGYFTFLDHRIVETGSALRNRPRFAGGLMWQVSPHACVTVRGDIRIVGRRFDLQIPTNENTVAGYVRINLAATASLTNDLRLYGVIENATDAAYEEFLGFPAPGIAVRFGIDYTL